MAEPFGTLPSGETVERATIGDDDLSVSILSWGATMQSIHLAGVPFSLCLGFETLDEYLNGGAHVGAVVGQVANRIGGGRARIDGEMHAFDRNEAGRHTLHGGSAGISLKNWVFCKEGPRVLHLSQRVLPGEMGFPGTLDITARYAILDGGVLEIALEATTDAPTICNLAPHPYFNLNGFGDARKQGLWVDAPAITAVDEEKIPTGALDPVWGTGWDHRLEKSLISSGLKYDTNFCLSPERKPIRPVARLTGQQGGVSMTVATTEPGLQVYDGEGLSSPYAGIALEPQAWPDAPNHPDFPSIELRPGQTSRQITRLTFQRM